MSTEPMSQRLARIKRRQAVEEVIVMADLSVQDLADALFDALTAGAETQQERDSRLDELIHALGGES